MANRTYPRFGYFFVDGYEGGATIFEGHNLDAAVIERALGTADFKRAEVYFDYVPRIKWCERIGAWPCDNEGEWHSHYIPVKPNPDFAYTLAWESY